MIATPLRPAPILTQQRCVVFFCTYEKSLVLLAKRLDGGWSCGSGHCDSGERPRQAVIREVSEEFEAQVVRIQQLGRRGNVYDFLVELDSDQVSNAAPEEHSAVEWYDLRRPDTWPTPRHPRFAEFLRIYYGKILNMMR